MNVRFKPTYKIAVFGAEGVGKATIAKSFSKIVAFPGDVSIVEQTSNVRSNQVDPSFTLNHSDGGFLVFSLLDKKSFDDLPAALKRMKTYVNCPIVLIGTNADLLFEKTDDYVKVVKFAETNELHYEEIAATNVDDVEKIFQLLTEKILQTRLMSDIEREMSKVGPSRVPMRDELLKKCREAKTLNDNIVALKECGAEAQKDHESRSGSRWFAFGSLFKKESTTKKIADDLIVKYQLPNL